MARQINLEKRLFPILVPTPEERGGLVRNNRIVDNCLDIGEIVPEKYKKNSICRATIMYGPKKCNFKCPNYCCTEGIAKGVLNAEQTNEVINQASKLGANVTYWPGLGESFFHKNFLDILSYVNEKGMKSVVFTNGSVFWDDNLAKESTGMSSNALIDKVNDLGVYLYVKYWNSDNKKAAEMTGVTLIEYPYSKFNGSKIPLALKRLLEKMPKERLGVEIMVSKENYGDVVQNLIPTINKLGIYGYLEPVIFSGKAEGKQRELSLTEEQHDNLKDLFVSGGTYCERRQSIELILVGDRLSPGIVINPREEDKVIDEFGNVEDIFGIFHNPYFRKVRRISKDLDGCLCRAVWNGKIKLE